MGCSATVVCLTLLFFKKTYSIVDVEFPDRYLKPDVKPTMADLDILLDTLERLSLYLHAYRNITDSNVKLCAFFASAILLRTSKDYGRKLGERGERIKKLYRRADDILAHMSRPDLQHLRDYTHIYQIMSETMSTFNTGVLSKWLVESEPMSEYSLRYDTLSVTRPEYAYIIEQYLNQSYPIIIKESDSCLEATTWNIPPTTSQTPLHKCKSEPHCPIKLFEKPSIAYNLSHRQLNAMLYLLGYRCYFHSAKKDLDNLHELCAEMYRECVFIQRKGYFALDMFAEHIALCSFLGYEEFHRRHWFYRLATFVNDNGCIKETNNFQIYRARHIRKTLKGDSLRKSIEKLAEKLENECGSHEMAVTAVALSAGIRHAAHHVTTEHTRSEL